MKKVRNMLENIKAKYLFLFLWIVMTASYLLYIVVSNRAAIDGQTYYQIQERIKALELENNILENEIASESSLRAINEKARGMGFSEAERIEYIK